MTTNSRRPDNSGNHLSTRKRASYAPKTFQNGNARTYIDQEGYNVIEQKTPTTHIVLRYNPNTDDVIYSYNSHTKYRGSISDFETNFDMRFDNLFSDLDSWMDSLDAQLDLLDDWLDTKFPYGNTSPRLTGSSSYRRSSSDIFGSPHSSYYHKKRKKRNGGGCFGCLLWSILIFVIICLILYGMGTLGGAIIDFFKSFF